MNVMTTPSIALSADHPGVSDPVYLERRATIAAASQDRPPGSPPPFVTYTPVEDGVWQTVSALISRASSI